MLTHFSLCTGIGGIDLAAETAGFTTVAQCEINDFASLLLAKNFKGVPNLHDIRTINHDTLRIRNIDTANLTVLSAGFPCQPYSLAGKGLGDGDSRDLWAEVARCIGLIRPKWFVGENTPGLFARANQKYFRRILADLAALGYSVSWGIWGACDEGAPHERKRVFIVAYADGERNKGQRTYEPQKLSAGTPIRICGPLPNVASNKLGLHGSTEQTQSLASCWANNGVRVQENASRERWQVEPDVGRVADGIPSRVDRLRCLGNAVVPWQILPVFEAIAAYEKE